MRELAQDCLPVHDLPEVVHEEGQTEGPFAGARRVRQEEEEEVRLQEVQDVIWRDQFARHSHAESHRGQASRMQSVQENIHVQCCLGQARAAPHRYEVYGNKKESETIA